MLCQIDTYSLADALTFLKTYYSRGYCDFFSSVVLVQTNFQFLMQRTVLSWPPGLSDDLLGLPLGLLLGLLDGRSGHDLDSARRRFLEEHETKARLTGFFLYLQYYEEKKLGSLYIIHCC